MLAGNANRIVNGEPPLEPTAPTGRATLSQSMALARIHQYLSMATPLLWTRQADTIGVLGLALNACDERNGSVDELDQIRELLDEGQRGLARAARGRRRGLAGRAPRDLRADPPRRIPGGDE